jgi:glycosyltransferase involved in cell wall biosynthesis
MTRPAADPAPSVLSIFPTFAMGGAQARFVALANHFGRRLSHRILAMDGRTDARERLSPTLDVTFPQIAVRRGTTFGNVPGFRRALHAWRPDLLLTHNWGSLEWAMANLLPLVPHIHFEDGFGPEERERQLPRRVYARRVLLRRSTVVLPSRTLERIATDIWRLPAARLRQIPNGIDLARFAVPPAALPGEGPIVGTVAALRPEKNLARLLHAFARAVAGRPGRLVIVGDGSERTALERLAADLGIADRTLFAGHVAEPAPLIAGFDIFALSSDTEQMPISLLEAMAAGRPAVATDVGDIRIMLPSENRGFVVPPDAAALAAALGTLMDDAALRARLGAANLAWAQREYDQEKMFAAYEALFAGALAKRARRS